jgi:hypothetical protein
MMKRIEKILRLVLLSPHISEWELYKVPAEVRRECL